MPNIYSAATQLSRPFHGACTPQFRCTRVRGTKFPCYAVVGSYGQMDANILVQGGAEHRKRYTLAAVETLAVEVSSSSV